MTCLFDQSPLTLVRTAESSQNQQHWWRTCRKTKGAMTWWFCFIRMLILVETIVEVEIDTFCKPNILTWGLFPFPSVKPGLFQIEQKNLVKLGMFFVVMGMSKTWESPIGSFRRGNPCHPMYHDLFSTHLNELGSKTVLPRQIFGVPKDLTWLDLLSPQTVGSAGWRRGQNGSELMECRVQH